MLVPSRTLAVLAGASEWPGFSGQSFPSAPAFRNTAVAARAYLTADNGLGLPTEHVLDLFDESDVQAHYTRMEDFLSERSQLMSAPHGHGVTVLFWYIGHGAFLGSSRDYCLLLRGTREIFGPETSIRVSSLADALRRLVPRSTRLLFLDCCFAAEAAKHFQGSLDQAVAAQLDEAVQTQVGVVVLAASGSRQVALLEDETTTTRFGSALLDVLRRGDPQRGTALSVRDLSELAWQRLSSTADRPPRPQVHAPEQAYGDLSTVPLFPNRAASATTTRDASPSPAGPPASPTPDQESAAALLTTTLDATPVAALRAARRLAERQGFLDEELVDRVPTAEWRRRLLRLAVQGDKERAAGVLVPSILAADQRWHHAVRAACLLSPRLYDAVAHDLARALPDSPGIEASRLVVEGLGRMGAAGYAEPIIAEAEAGEYTWQKMGGYVGIALARMVRFCEGPYGESSVLRDALMHWQTSFLERHGQSTYIRSVLFEIYREMRQLRVWHADTLIRDYLRSDSDLLVDLGATALGHLRLLRAVPHLSRRYSLGVGLGPATRRKLLLEIARIGGPDAVTFLQEVKGDPSARVALSRCLDSAREDEFEHLVVKALHGEAEEPWWVYRAIGRRPTPSLLPHLESGLSSDEPSNRGVAALSLARALGAGARDRVQAARAEAGVSIEHALTALAVLIATGDESIVAEIEDLLSAEAWLYEPVLFDDVLAVLEGWGGRPGHDLAEMLRWVHTAP